MSLPAPILDDRSYDQLRDELLSRISVYLPEWTDVGPSDPGVTLLELVASVGESMLFRFNQIPDQTRLWLLRLLQLLPYPARQATGLVQFELANEADASASVLEGTSLHAGAIPFRVGNDVTVLPFTVSAVVKATADLPTDPILRDEYQRVLDAADLDESKARPFQEVVLDPDPGAPGFVPLAVETAVDRFLWIAVHHNPKTFDAQRTALLGQSGVLSRSPLILGIAPDTEYPTIDEVDPCEGTTLAPEAQRLEDMQALWSAEQCSDELAPGPEMPGFQLGPASTLVWQVSARSQADPAVSEYIPVTVVRDTTDALRRSGVVALQLLPSRLADIGVGDLADPDLAGVDDRPPALADGPPVLFWLRVFSRDGTPPLHRLKWLGMNAADVAQVADAPAEFVGLGTGLSHQEFGLAHSPVVDGTLRVQVLDGTEWRDWVQVETFAASAAADRHFIGDAEAGRIKCGDGVRGQVFAAGAQIRATSYRYGGGRNGLVKVDAIKQSDAVGVTVRNPLPTVGGEDAEPITSALERIPGELARHDRAVTAGDFTALAKLPDDRALRDPADLQAGRDLGGSGGQARLQRARSPAVGRVGATAVPVAVATVRAGRYRVAIGASRPRAGAGGRGAAGRGCRFHRGPEGRRRQLGNTCRGHRRAHRLGSPGGQGDHRRRGPCA